MTLTSLPKMLLIIFNAVNCYNVLVWNTWFIAYTFRLRNWNGRFQDAVYISKGPLRWRITQTYCTEMLHTVQKRFTLFLYWFHLGLFNFHSRIIVITNEGTKILVVLVTNALKSITKTAWNLLVAWCTMRNMVHHILSESNIVKNLFSVFSDIYVLVGSEVLCPAVFFFLFKKVVYVHFPLKPIASSLILLKFSIWSN